MNILIISYAYSPSLGGIETVAGILAQEFKEMGHHVIVVTHTLCSVDESTNGVSVCDAVFRRPSAYQLLRLAKWADVVLVNNPTVKYAWPCYFWPKRWLVVHHTWLPKEGVLSRLKTFFKRIVFSRATTAAVSSALATSLSRQCIVLPNPYDSNVFRLIPELVRDQEVAFVGRLVSDKGCDLLLRALAHMSSHGISVHSTIIGEGTESSSLRSLAALLGIADQTAFVGKRTGLELATILNRHRVLVVPSFWPEPFGLVALEGLACGCVVVAANHGGLPEAMGALGLKFVPNDTCDLARCLELALFDSNLVTETVKVTDHLSKHTRRTVAVRYLEAWNSSTIR